MVYKRTVCGAVKNEIMQNKKAITITNAFQKI